MRLAGWILAIGVRDVDERDMILGDLQEQLPRRGSCSCRSPRIMSRSSTSRTPIERIQPASFTGSTPSTLKFARPQDCCGS